LKAEFSHRRAWGSLLKKTLRIATERGGEQDGIRTGLGVEFSSSLGTSRLFVDAPLLAISIFFQFFWSRIE
jgi:hypothetical protein